jgi:PP-loop superfamily ATP-utilizing enzyme
LESSLKKSKKKIEKFKEDLKIEKETLARFKEKVKNQTVYACYFCTRKVFATLNDLNNHYKRRHENETPKPQEN